MAPRDLLALDGQFESSVLGTFRIVRGFADLRDLAAISVPYEMEAAEAYPAVRGQQRQLNPVHAARIKKYLESGEQRFLPEVILSVRLDLAEELDSQQRVIGVQGGGPDMGLQIRRRWTRPGAKVHRLAVDRTKLDEIRAARLVRRVDGNHRLAMADQLMDDPLLKTKYLASFCLVLLAAPGNAADDFSESLIFHTINSTALPLESEHALRLILGQHPEFDMTPEQEFGYSPELHFTRLLRDGFIRLPDPAQSRLGSKPLTSLRNAARGVLELDPALGADLEDLRRCSRDLLAALNDVVARLEPTQPRLSHASYFVELAARVWQGTDPAGHHAARVGESVNLLEQIALWLGQDGLAELSENQSLSKQVLDIYAAVRARVPRKVFVARWYPPPEEGEAHQLANLRLAQVRRTLDDLRRDEAIALELVDMGTREGGTFPIHQEMYEAIASSDIILIDLTGIRPNVCVEAGFALSHHEKGRLLFMFQRRGRQVNVPFDLSTFRYEPFRDAAEIPGKLGPQLTAIVRTAAAGR